MKIAIVGSREYPDWKQVIDYVQSLPLDTIVVSGGARGVDRIAEQVARKRGMTVQIFHAEWDKYGKSAGMIRNQFIVDYADSVVAFLYQNSSGTMNTIERAKRAGKPVTVIDAA
jgi:predicted Rossmann fold nucleotide-binding protein DprA/Smf involved in DNA uptake